MLFMAIYASFSRARWPFGSNEKSESDAVTFGLIFQKVLSLEAIFSVTKVYIQHFRICLEMYVKSDGFHPDVIAQASACIRFVC